MGLVRTFAVVACLALAQAQGQQVSQVRPPSVCVGRPLSTPLSADSHSSFLRTGS
jgi:hypothetical protein